MNIKQFFIATMAMLTFSVAATADDYTHSMLAVQGYDVVSYQTEKQPVRGNGNFTASYEGVDYQFSSKANLETFEVSPKKYAPAYGGFCAYGAALGKKFIGDPEIWRVVDGTLYLNLDADIQDKWVKDVPGHIKLADAKWKEIKDKSPASL